MGCLGMIIAGLFFVGRWSLILLYYSFPVIIFPVAIVLGVTAGNGAWGTLYEDWEDEQIAAHTHRLTIVWDAGNTYTIYVRDDVNWTINGSGNAGLYYTDFAERGHSTDMNPSISLPSYANKAGKTFLGLFTDRFGGTQFVNGKGYSLRTVHEDLTLYAVWGDTVTDPSQNENQGESPSVWDNIGYSLQYQSVGA